MATNIYKLTIFCFVLFLSSGCASLISIGELETYCQEHGADYSDIGICGDPYNIYKNSDEFTNTNGINQGGCSTCN